MLNGISCSREKHFGGIAPGYKVMHKNGITVDNRLENLILCPEGISENCSSDNIEDSLYWSAIIGMPHEVSWKFLCCCLQIVCHKNW